MKRIAAAAATTAMIAATALFAPVASAGNVAWNVSIGGPGFAVSAGQPGYWGGGYRGGYGYHAGYGYRPAYGGWHRPYYRPVGYAPIVYPAPIAVTVPFAAPVYVPLRRVYVPAPVVAPAPGPYGY